MPKINIEQEFCPDCGAELKGGRCSAKCNKKSKDEPKPKDKKKKRN